MTYFEAYLLTIVDSVDALFVLIGILLLFLIVSASILLGFSTCYTNDDYNKQKKLTKSIWKISLPICIVSFLFATLLPSSKEVAFIYIAPKIINNTDLKNSIKEMPKLTTLGLEYLNDILEKKTNDLKK